MEPLATQAHPTPIDQTALAVERTYLAYERTLMAWIRTATSLIAFGFALYKFVFFLSDEQLLKHQDQVLQSRVYSIIMMSFGISVLAIASIQYRTLMKRLRANAPGLPRSLSMILAGQIAVLGVVSLLIAIFRA